MNENISKFLEKVGQDKDLQEKFNAIRNLEEAYKLAATVQDGFTQQEFETEMKRLYEEMSKDLSEEDMARIAGGVDKDTSFAISTTAVVSVGGVVAAPLAMAAAT